MTVGSLTASGDERVRTSPAVVAAVKLLGLTFQLGLAILVIRNFSLEGPIFYRMILLAAAGFLVNAVLPRETRQAWFIVVSLGAIAMVFGMRDGLWLVAIGLSLIGLCHLPLRWSVRVGIIVLVAAALAATRSGWLTAPFSVSVWPILGSMFMFRLMVYLHHLKHNPTKVSPGRALAYFFMLPNVAFPLFPVVDYKTFDSVYYDQDPFATYQAGLRYIARGLLHLVVYRYVYYYVMRDPAEVSNLADLLTYVVSTFLVYVHVSGQFHVIVGVLHLFGWRMPPANNLYYLASGFTDIWRRNNIYWKDFMMKLAYYPSFFKLRQQGGKVALVGATVVVFLLTWLLHSYQWYWIRGDFPLAATDMLFWGLVGGFMLVEMLRETAQGAARATVKRGWSASRAFRTVGFFLFFSTLWALWDSQSVGDFISLWAVAPRYDTQTLVVIGFLLAAALAIAGWPWTAQGLKKEVESRPFWQRQDLQTVFVCGGLLAFAQPGVTNLVSPSATTFAQSLRETKLNERDAASQHRGYYEQLNVAGGGVRGGELDAVNEARPADWVPLTETAVFRELPSFLGGELVPGSSVDFKGEMLNVNALGMRDRIYPHDKPAGTYRIVLLGPSDVMGAGVADTQTFEALLESRLNRELAPASGTRYELLNFSVVSFSLLQQMQMLQERAMDFNPDMVVVAYHPISEARFAFQYLANRVRFGREVPYPELREIAERAGVRKGMEQPDAFRRLKPYGPELVQWSLNRIAAQAKARNTSLVLFVRDMPAEVSDTLQPMFDVARGLGYAVVDARDAYAGRDPKTLLLAQWDKHPNALGHRLMADRLYHELVTRQHLIKP
jgi:hypothetical protein